MLTFEICSVCEESHALRPDGLGMAIHDTAAGERCPGPARPKPQRVPRRPESKPQREREVKRVVDPELQAAFDIAGGTTKQRRSTPEPSAKFDRRIYAVGSQHRVRGGLPSLGRRR